MEVIIDSITNSEDTKDEVNQRSDRGVLTINVTGLITTPRTRRLGSFDGTLGQFLFIVLISLNFEQHPQKKSHLVEADQLRDLTILSRARKSSSSSYIRRDKSLGGVGTTENGTHIIKVLVLDKVWGTK